MPLQFVNRPKDITWISTGFWGLDYALRNNRGQQGFPSRTMVEVYGFEGVGKSTFCWTIASKLAGQNKIAIAALETLDPDYLEFIMNKAGFNGSVEFSEGETDEAVVNMLCSAYARDDVSCGILDSVGAISPLSEIEGEIGEANMGKRARITAQLSRRVQNSNRNKTTPSVMFLISHIAAIIGGRGTDTTGGISKKFLSAIRIRLKKLEGYDDGSYLLEGKCEKNRWGIEDTTFRMFYLEGFGFHPGMTAIMDGDALGVFSTKSVVKINGDSYGRLSKLAEKAKEGDNAVFEPFFIALKEWQKA